MAANYRAKNDGLNHFWGGFVGAATAAVGIRGAGPGLAVCYGVLGGIIAGLYIQIERNEGTSISGPYPHWNSPTTAEFPHDFTYVDARLDQRFRGANW